MVANIIDGRGGMISSYDSALMLRSPTINAEGAIPFRRLDRHKSHIRSAHSFANRLGIRCIILVRLDIQFDKLRGHQTHRMSVALQRAAPMMRAGAGLHANYAWRQIPKEDGIPAPVICTLPPHARAVWHENLDLGTQWKDR